MGSVWQVPRMRLALMHAYLCDTYHSPITNITPPFLLKCAPALHAPRTPQAGRLWMMWTMTATRRRSSSREEEQ